jgi:hypothetical protein
VQSQPNEFTVAVHGNDEGPAIQDNPNNNDWRHIDFEDFVKKIKFKLDTDKKHYTSIRLLACQTGKGDFPQKLADRLGMTVIAPTGYVELSGKGKYQVFQDEARTKRLTPEEAWKPFKPEKIDRPVAPEKSIGKKSDVTISL